MATIIENVVEPIIEDPVIDILAEPTDAFGKDEAAASQVPVSKLMPGPKLVKGGGPQADDEVLLDEEDSPADTPVTSPGAADTADFTLQESGNFSFTPTTADPGDTSFGPEPLGFGFSGTSSAQIADIFPPDLGAENNQDVDAAEPIESSDGGTTPNEMSGGSGGSGDTPAPTENNDDQVVASTGDTVTTPVNQSSHGGSEGATVFGTAGDDIIDVGFVFPAEVRTEPGTLQGTTHNADVVTGSDGDDAINGGGGDDALAGGSDDDTLSGGSGNDVVLGGAGDDTLDGGAGTDALAGGSGADRFVFDDVAESPAHAPDLVFDFNAVQGDQIDVSGIDAIIGTPENDAFIFIGGDAFSSTTGELRFEADALWGVLEADVTGNGEADFAVNLLGVSSLTPDDIIGLG